MVFFVSCQNDNTKKSKPDVQRPTLRQINEEGTCPSNNCPKCKTEEPKDKCCSNEKIDASVSTSTESNVGKHEENEVSADATNVEDLTSENLTTDEVNAEVSSVEQAAADHVEDVQTSQN